MSQDFQSHSPPFHRLGNPSIHPSRSLDPPARLPCEERRLLGGLNWRTCAVKLHYFQSFAALHDPLLDHPRLTALRAGLGGLHSRAGSSFAQLHSSYNVTQNVWQGRKRQGATAPLFGRHGRLVVSLASSQQRHSVLLPVDFSVTRWTFAAGRARHEASAQG